MSGRTLLPSGARRKASQRHKHDAVLAPTSAPSGPQWQPGDKVRWRDYAGHFLRDADDGQAELLIGTRTYRVHKGELQRV
jgi:hypothetical protein